MRKLLWDLFIHTGKIEYYLKYKELLRGELNERCDSRKNL